MPTGLRWERSDSGRIFRRFERSTGETAVVHAPIFLKDDFLGDVLQDPWNICLGSDGACAGAIIAGQSGGLLRLTSGANVGATPALDIAMLNAGLNFVTGVHYDLNLEVKIRMNTAVTGGTMGIGFTDVHSTTGSTEEPSSIATATLTTNATDGVGLLFDTGATSKKFHVWGVNDGTDSVFYDTNVAPVADVFNILRVQLTSGLQLKAWIDGVLVKTQADAIKTAIPIGLYAYVNSTTNASVVCDIDYVALWASR